MEHSKRHCDIMQLFDNNNIVKVAAPMVRYSKLQFRTLLRKHSCDLCYTPMILADSFCHSVKARNNEFTTNICDSPLVTQFASNEVKYFVDASKLISPFCDGVDLNCGCPQGWAKQMGVGCKMLESPELIADLVRQCRNQILKPFTVSVKMRILNDIKKSVELCRRLEKCGTSFLTIHARTPSQLTGAINEDALRLLTESVNCPIVANGGVKTLKDCVELHKKTKAKGIMSANGLLTNPTLFTGTLETSLECVKQWVNICFNSTLNLQTYKSYQGQNTLTIPEKPANLTFQCFHHHLVFMLEKVLPKTKKRIFNNYQTFADVLNFLREEFNIIPQLFEYDEFHACVELPINYDNCDEAVKVDVLHYNYNDEGKYFKQKSKSILNENSEEIYDLTGIFIEN